MGIYKPGRPSKYNPSAGGSKPPSSPGEYRIRDNSGQMCYIGETCDQSRCANEHRRTGKLAEGSTFEYKVADGRSTSATRREHERSKIAQHNPILNRSSGGEGRIATRKKFLKRRNLTWQDGFFHPRTIKAAGGTVTIAVRF